MSSPEALRSYCISGYPVILTRYACIRHHSGFNYHYYNNYRCVLPLPTKIDRRFNKEQNDVEEGYATVSVVRGVDIIPVTSNKAYGRCLQSQMLTHHDQDIIYEEIRARDCHVTHGSCAPYAVVSVHKNVLRVE